VLRGGRVLTRLHFSYGRLFDLPATTQMNIQDVVQTQRKWARLDGTLSVGAALRTPIVAAQSPTPSNVPLPPTSATADVIEAEVLAIREARLPYTMHVGGKIRFRIRPWSNGRSRRPRGFCSRALPISTPTRSRRRHESWRSTRRSS